MKLAFSTLGCPEWTFAQILDNAARMGYSALEIRGIEGQMAAADIEYFKPGRQQTTKRMLKDRGLTMCGFGSSLSYDAPEKAGEMFDEGKRTVDVCAAMDIPRIRVFGNTIPEGRSISAAADMAAEGITRLCEYAEGTPVEILLEVHGNFNTVEIMQAVLSRISHPKFGILWDVAHSDRIYGDGWQPFYETVLPKLRHIHIKDHRRVNGETQLCRVGEGDIPLKDIVRRVCAEGYNGYFSLEWEKKWHPELPSCDTEFPAFPGFMEQI